MNNKLCLIAFLYLTSFQSYAVGQAGCALPNAGKEIAEGEVFGNTPLTEDEQFRKAVSLEGQYWSNSKAANPQAKIGLLSNAKTNNAAAYARAKINVGGLEGFEEAEDGIYQTSGNININVKYGSVKNESWITTVNSDTPGEFEFRINNVNKYMERLEKEYAVAGQSVGKISGTRVNPLTRKFIQEYLTFSDDGLPFEEGGRLLNEVSGLPGMHAEVLAFNDMVNIAEEYGVTLTEEELSRITIATVRVSKLPLKTGFDFTACPNCSGILNRTGVSIITNDPL
ncbi:MULTISPECIES: YwqJ-related putative deaminase [Pseudoalteromonas]|uniref:Adhesin n=1 Tax=Pseudoalteromonas amylolytica TaxID=1859457 RepID=A0A1S1MYJ0_9GAMM|nr:MULTISPECIES: YwqJ-related putative deaminase [Pseudoalteromonas]OHU90567.1 hypothetical protein BFC16_02885 [Pseudoalteromonas sp. JW3]OHU92812.1 hypothetical protein BET10_05010 [Pseudoalteromonas amylolytica]